MKKHAIIGVVLFVVLGVVIDAALASSAGPAMHNTNATDDNHPYDITLPDDLEQLGTDELIDYLDRLADANLYLKAENKNLKQEIAIIQEEREHYQRIILIRAIIIMICSYVIGLLTYIFNVKELLKFRTSRMLSRLRERQQKRRSGKDYLNWSELHKRDSLYRTFHEGKKNKKP